MNGIQPRLSTPNVSIQLSAMHKLLTDEKLPAPSSSLGEGNYLKALVSLSKAPKKVAAKKRKRKSYSYVRHRVSRYNGKHTTVSFSQCFWALHVDTLRLKPLKAMLCDIAANSILRTREPTFSAKARREIIRRTKAQLCGVRLKRYTRRLDALGLEPKPSEEFYIVSVPAPTRTGQTTIRVRKSFCDRGRAILGKETFKALMYTASEAYDKEPFKRRGYRALYITGYVCNLISDLSPFI